MQGCYSIADVAQIRCAELLAYAEEYDIGTFGAAHYKTHLFKKPPKSNFQEFEDTGIKFLLGGVSDERDVWVRSGFLI